MFFNVFLIFLNHKEIRQIFFIHIANVMIGGANIIAELLDLSLLPEKQKWQQDLNRNLNLFFTAYFRQFAHINRYCSKQNGTIQKSKKFRIVDEYLV